MTIGSAGVAWSTGRAIELPRTKVVSGDRRRVSEGDAVPKVGDLASEHGISDLYVSAAQAMGASLESLGDPAQCQGPLPQL
ncbi:MAG: hypothetical protein AAGF11_06165 [Myxococcota bacterium]